MRLLTVLLMVVPRRLGKDIPLVSSNNLDEQAMALSAV